MARPRSTKTRDWASPRTRWLWRKRVDRHATVIHGPDIEDMQHGHIARPDIEQWTTTSNNYMYSQTVTERQHGPRTTTSEAMTSKQPVNKRPSDDTNNLRTTTWTTAWKTTTSTRTTTELDILIMDHPRTTIFGIVKNINNSELWSTKIQRTDQDGLELLGGKIFGLSLSSVQYR